MAVTPVWSQVPRVATVLVSAANTGRDGTGTIVDLLTGIAAGTRIDRVQVNAIGTTTAGVIRLWLHNGTGYFLLKEILVTAITPSTSIAVFTSDVYRSDGLPVAWLATASWKIGASTHNAESFHVTALGGDLVIA